MDSYVFDLIESIVSIGSLTVSIFVFVNTIRKTNKERTLEASKERYYTFLKKTDELFRKIDPEVYYDELTVIYGADVTEADAAAVSTAIQEKVGNKVEVTVIPGGQPVYYYFLSLE